MKIFRLSLALLLSYSLLITAAPGVLAGASQTGQSSASQPAPSPAKQTPEELQQLVAPIALYPDALVSQILAGQRIQRK